MILEKIPDLASRNKFPIEKLFVIIAGSRSMLALEHTGDSSRTGSLGVHTSANRDYTYNWKSRYAYKLMATEVSSYIIILHNCSA